MDQASSILASDSSHPLNSSIRHISCSRKASSVRGLGCLDAEGAVSRFTPPACHQHSQPRAVKLTWDGDSLLPEVPAHGFSPHTEDGRMSRLNRSRRHQPSPSAEGHIGRWRPSAGTAGPFLRRSPAPAGVAGQVERRSDVVRQGEFENLPSFRAER
jgi:hypothetical protein